MKILKKVLNNDKDSDHDSDSDEAVISEAANIKTVKVLKRIF